MPPEITTLQHHCTFFLSICVSARYCYNLAMQPISERRPRQILVMVDAANGSHRRIAEGIAHFAAAQPHWDIRFAGGVRDYALIKPAMDQADGIITSRMAANRELLDTLRCPAVFVGEVHPKLPSIIVDERRIGELAGRHFQELGLTNLGFSGIEGVRFADARRDAFVSWAAKRNLQVSCCGLAIYLGMEQDQESLGRLNDWIRSLPLPAGILVATTIQAHLLVNACHSLGLRIPDQIAIMGVDEDELYCEMTRPRLTMIDQGGVLMGRRAGELLEHLMNGGQPPSEPILIPPQRVIPHESTDMIFTDSPLLAQAIRYIRNHAHEGIRVPDVMRHVPVSRRVLEKQFRAELDTTIAGEILRVRLRNAKRLLEHTDFPIEAIAIRSGFSSASKFSRVFGQHEKLSPREFRSAARDKAAAAPVEV